MRDLNDQEIKWCVIMLGTTRMSYEEIARLFVSEFPDFERELNNEIIILKLKQRLKDYRNKKDRPQYAEIKALQAESISTSDAFMKDPDWREDERQDLYDQAKQIVEEIETTTDKDNLMRLKLALDGKKMLLNVVENREKHQLNREKMENAGKTGHGFTLPEEE